MISAKKLQELLKVKDDVSLIEAVSPDNNLIRFYFNSNEFIIKEKDAKELRYTHFNINQILKTKVKFYHKNNLNKDFFELITAFQHVLNFNQK